VTQVLSMVAGTVPPERVAGLRAAYDQLVAGGFPDGLVETSLCRGQDDEWMVVTLWRDRAALVALRASGEAPAAVRLFTDAGARPRVGIFDVTATAEPQAAGAGSQ
jgi:heme-degrading monooxygenase HmoA